MSRAVITGVGVVSAFGVGAAVFLDALAAGAKAVGPIRSFDVSGFPVQVGGEVPVVRPDAAWVEASLGRLGLPALDLDEPARRGCFRDRKVAFALLAAAEALREADPGVRRAPLVLGLGLEAAFLDDLAAALARGSLEAPPEPGAPALRIRSSVDLSAEVVASALGLEGPRIVSCSACAAGAMALAQAASLIERGEASVVLAGGADSMINPMGMGAFHRLGATSPRAADDACRPFDLRRDGLVIGEGAAVFLVEDEARAVARGARRWARLRGWATTQDAYRATAPRSDGAAAARAMRRALARAGVEAGEVGYVNAHGTGTPLNDPAEARALREALGEHGARVPVSSIKGAVGHLMAASGAIEAAACLLPLTRAVMPGTANLREVDPECLPLHVIGEAPRGGEVRVALSNSFGFGGQNAALVLERVPAP